MKEVLRLCIVLTVIGAVCAGVMAFTDQKTKAPITEMRKQEKVGGVKLVLPPVDNKPDEDAITIKENGDSLTFYRGKKDGAWVGAAFSIIAPNGYAGGIDLLVGIDTAGVVTGIEVLRHAETPGLGDKITTVGFRKQYIGKSITNPANWSVIKDGGPFRQITGATISSRAVTTAVARGLEFFDAHKTEVFTAAGGAKESGTKSDRGEAKK